MFDIESFVQGGCFAIAGMIIISVIRYYIDNLEKIPEIPEDEYFQKGYDYYPNETNIPLIRTYDDLRAKSFMNGYSKAYQEHIETKMLNMITNEGDV